MVSVLVPLITVACLVMVPVRVVPCVLVTLAPPVLLVVPSLLHRVPSVVRLFMMVGLEALLFKSPMDLLTLWVPTPGEVRWAVSRLSPVPRLRK